MCTVASRRARWARSAAAPPPGNSRRESAPPPGNSRRESVAADRPPAIAGSVLRVFVARHFGRTLRTSLVCCDAQKNVFAHRCVHNYTVAHKATTLYFCQAVADDAELFERSVPATAHCARDSAAVSAHAVLGSHLSLVANKLVIRQEKVGTYHPTAVRKRGC